MRKWKETIHKNRATHMKFLDMRGLDDYLRENKSALQYQINFQNNVKNHEVTFTVIEVGDRTHVILYDQCFIEATRDSTKWFMDATFSIVPRIKGAKQFLTVMAEKYGKVIRPTGCVT